MKVQNISKLRQISLRITRYNKWDDQLSVQLDLTRFPRPRAAVVPLFYFGKEHAKLPDSEGLVSNNLATTCY